jgi:hypothetical protein
MIRMLFTQTHKGPKTGVIGATGPRSIARPAVIPFEMPVVDLHTNGQSNAIACERCRYTDLRRPLTTLGY